MVAQSADFADFGNCEPSKPVRIATVLAGVLARHGLKLPNSTRPATSTADQPSWAPIFATETNPWNEVADVTLSEALVVI